MKQKIMVATAIALLSTAAYAGQKTPFPVDVDLVNLTASGDMLTAANARNDNEFIGCGSRSISDGAGGVFRFGFCQAEDADGERAFCNTSDAGLLDEIRTVSDFSFVTFSYNEDGECTRIGFSTQSFYITRVRR
ncbi:MAG: hypothetical protein QNJ00_00300 [Woeseiaceae bacterium]|nr:hypothetical protein [Woeseiaceae bacterium]